MRPSLALSTVALGLFLTSGCDPKANQGGDTAKPGQGNAALASGCEDFVSLVCNEAGSESSSCGAARETAKLLHASACAAAMANAGHTRDVLAARASKCTELTDRLCKDIGSDTQTCGLLKSDNGPNDPAGCEAMLEDYEAVLGEVRAMEAKNAPLPADKAAKIAAPGGPEFGPMDAKVTIVEFSDFECPYCAMAAAVAKRVETEYAGKVRFVFRQFPLSFHPNAHLTAQASLAAHAQGKFWPFHDLVFANQKALSRSDLEGYAKEAGLDLEAFNKDLDAGTYKDQVDGELDMGGEVYVSGTPSMFLNGKPVGNPTDYDSLAAMIDAALAE